MITGNAESSGVFDGTWLEDARAKQGGHSWVDDVIATLDNPGSKYLALLRLWFDRFPVSQKQKHDLRKRLESFNSEEHLGAVNELAWWTFMQQEGLKAIPVPTSTTPRPDFQVIAPAACFVEVSTLNVSDADKSKFETGRSVELDHADTLRRILGKVTGEKLRQLSYGAEQKKPAVVVLFDYTTWSAFGTHFYRFLADFLLGKQLGFQSLPSELSALLYVERKVCEGRIALSRRRSATYYNPCATHPLPLGTFAFLNQFWCENVTIEPESPDDWVWL